MNYKNRKQGLDEHNQKIISILANSEIVVKFLNRSDHSFGNDKENVKILATIAFALYILLFRYVGVETNLHKADITTPRTTTTTII